MADTAKTTKLTSDGAQKLLAAAISKARELNVPQCICIVDAGGQDREVAAAALGTIAGAQRFRF